MSEVLTGAEVKKALEICISGDCDLCSCKCESVGDCRDALNKKSLDLINRYEEKIADLTEEVKRMKLADKKCCSCFYSKPYTGESRTFKSYVECTNEVHLKTYCKSRNAKYRLRTTKACKCYKERTCDDRDS